MLRGGTLVDVASGKEISDSTIVMRGERIEQIGSGNRTIPEGAQIIDAKGKWIIPGLIDSHAHAENPDETPFSLYLANGVTTIRNPGGNITALRLTRERLIGGELGGHNATPTSGTVSNNVPQAAASATLRSSNRK